MRNACRVTLAVVALWVFVPTPAVRAQGGRGSIQGRATDSASGVLQGATVTVGAWRPPIGDGPRGRLRHSGSRAGAVTLVRIDFVGFTTFQDRVDIEEGGMVRLDATLQVAGQSESILVTRGAAARRGRADQPPAHGGQHRAGAVGGGDHEPAEREHRRRARPAAERDARARRRRRQVRADPRDRAAAEQPDDRRRQRAVAGERRAADQAGHAGVGPRGVDRDQQDAAGEHGRRRHRRQREPPDQDRGRAADRHAVRRWAATRRSSAAAASSQFGAHGRPAVRRGQAGSAC